MSIWFQLTMGVASDEYLTTMALNANNLVFIAQGHIMLIVMLHCSGMWHQLAIRNDARVPALVDEK